MENNIMKNAEELTDKKIEEIISKFDNAIKNKTLKIANRHPLARKPLIISKYKLPKYVQREIEGI